MPRPPSASSGARRMRCPRCGRYVLRQLVGRRAALDVTADDTRLSAAAAAALREPNRLDWCVRATRDGLDLRWADCHRREAACRFEHVVDHECSASPTCEPPAARRPRRQPAVTAGQLTL